MSQSNEIEPGQYKCNPGFDDADIRAYEDLKGGTFTEPRPKKFRQSFSDLRENDLVTVEGNGCCSNCTSTSAIRYARTLHQEGHDVEGIAYYHLQSINGSGGEHPSDFEFDGVPIYYDALEKSDMTQKEVGELIILVLEENNIEYEWEDHDPAYAIFAKM